ncbi:hypothetical protein PBY51_002150 [Eleginops maclovinus]|uniref:Uncharacterized protein n=1 Tax=Eleginops maclovinus TaxID=56733 RepID=A0AAN7WYU7_ELEMC|nr:hypothetical protein PBY51_002150 [Eleginops maclovinus]
MRKRKCKAGIIPSSAGVLLFCDLVSLKTLGSFRCCSSLLVIDPFHCGSIAERTGPLLSSETSVQTVGSVNAPTPAP